ncbi:hypothetical protein [Helicobacter cappadocius]|uniref:Uncharacterized protein n=1 Tax=Helicobacter cappadocius TaxID=3063998 RepID=A0AA90PJD4_9HELI|nr:MULTISPECIES: hypothetical protein [unclassified Helicobacter]MDO7252417.1 hypothetical protein [Helicobacter sp. faydin-H75]MDP2538284.1 hypothetical protein [Helicobacter sp. faydin-H76]
MNKKSNIIYLEKQTNLYFDIDLNPAKISKNDVFITDIKARELLKYQLNIKKTDLFKVSNIRDYLYAKCIQEGFFQPQKDYIFSYIVEEKSLEFIYHIYAKNQEIRYEKNTIKHDLDIPVSFFIPDIFLPMALEDKYRESSLFLFEDSLVFYYQGNFVYHTFIVGQEDIDRALHYIQTIYSKISLLVCNGSKNFEADIPIYSLSEITKSSHPLPYLCFEYFQKQKSQDLPILHCLDNHPLKGSKTFSMLIKIACFVGLMLLLPLGKIGYGIYLNHQIKSLQLQNNQILQSINTSSKNNTTVFEQTKAQNQLQNHLHSLQKIQTSYTPRYNIIAEISKRLAGKDIFVKKFYFTSDIVENIQVLELDIASKSEQDLVDFMQDLSNTPLILVNTKSPLQNEKIYSNGIFKNNQALMTKIVWISNVL